MIDDDVKAAATQVLDECRNSGLLLTTVESCTGGLLIGSLTEIAGSSDVIDRGFVTYTNIAKNELVDVPMELFSEVGAVSREVALAMAAGGLLRSKADIAVGITGVAGPGQSENKPAGLVYICAVRRESKTLHERCVFDGNRSSVRKSSVLKAFELIKRLVWA